MSLKPVSAVRVSLWGRVVGVIAGQSAGYYRFEYDPDFIASGIEISPIRMKLRPGVIVCNDLPLANFRGLPPVFADSLPDSFGNELVNEWMRCQGISVESVTPLDRLAYVGNRGMGALTYEPVRGPRRSSSTAINMRKIVQDAQLALNGKLSSMSGGAALKEIFRVGTSAGGAQSKAVVGWNRATNQFCVGTGDLPDGYEHWLVKITPEDRPYSGIAEYRTYEKAVACGVEISESRLFELDGVRHFMTKRFDREGSRRHHLQTLRAMRHLVDERMGVDSLSYDQLFMTIEDLQMGYGALEQMFLRMAFNVYADESDDHSKNFSFLLREGGRWMLAPAYDLTGGVPPEAPPGDSRRQWENCHALSVNGKQSDISDDDLLAVADRYAIGTAPKILARIKEVFGRNR